MILPKRSIANEAGQMQDALEIATERAAEKQRQQKVRQEERERCAEIAEREPEMPGPMPNELHLVPLEDALRAVCRATKKSIAAAIRGK